jgi:hypothetical protein
MMQTLKILLLITVVGLLAFPNSSDAYTYSVAYDPGTLNVTSQITEYTTLGDMMDGMEITAFFVGGGSEQAIWGDTGPGAGGAFGTGWSLVQSGDTYYPTSGATWTLANTGVEGGIQSILIDAGPGDTVFDIVLDGNPANEGTPGSLRGYAFDALASTDDTLDILATYIDQVALTGEAPVGDLWRFLDIDFQDVPFGAENSLVFAADTDNILSGGDIQPVPIPSSLLLLGSGCAILISGFRRKS